MILDEQKGIQRKHDEERRSGRKGLRLFRTFGFMVASFSVGWNLGNGRSASDVLVFSESVKADDTSDLSPSIRESVPLDENGNPRNRTEVNGTVCFKWSEALEADLWWSHQPEFEPFNESDDGACFVRMQWAEKRAFFKKLHALQHDVDKCHLVNTRHMWSTGWGSDFLNVGLGLLYALENDRPLQISFVDSNDVW